MIEKAIEYVKQIFENDYSGHDYFHTMRVFRLASRLAEQKCRLADSTVGSIIT